MYKCKFVFNCLSALLLIFGRDDTLGSDAVALKAVRSVLNFTFLNTLGCGAVGMEMFDSLSSGSSHRVVIGFQTPFKMTSLVFGEKKLFSGMISSSFCKKL